jgi:hypothetical protein
MGMYSNTPTDKLLRFGKKAAVATGSKIKETASQKIYEKKVKKWATQYFDENEKYFRNKFEDEGHALNVYNTVVAWIKYYDEPKSYDTFKSHADSFFEKRDVVLNKVHLTEKKYSIHKKFDFISLIDNSKTFLEKKKGASNLRFGSSDEISEKFFQLFINAFDTLFSRVNFLQKSKNLNDVKMGEKFLKLVKNVETFDEMVEVVDKELKKEGIKLQERERKECEKRAEEQNRRDELLLKEKKKILKEKEVLTQQEKEIYLSGRYSMQEFLEKIKEKEDEIEHEKKLLKEFNKVTKELPLFLKKIFKPGVFLLEKDFVELVHKEFSKISDKEMVDSKVETEVSCMLSSKKLFYKKDLFELAEKELIGIPLKTNEGLPVQSLGEKKIADFLDKHYISYDYDEKISKRRLGLDAHGHDTKWVRPDFYLTTLGLIIEYWGMKGTPDYDEKATDKRRTYKESNTKYISIEPKHLLKIDEILRVNLKREGIELES